MPRWVTPHDVVQDNRSSYLGLSCFYIGFTNAYPVTQHRTCLCLSQLLGSASTKSRNVNSYGAESHKEKDGVSLTLVLH
jgi:hypothetical protein